MKDITTLSGDLRIEQVRIGIIASRFNALIVDSLVAGAVDTLRRHGIPDAALTLVYCPGAFELPGLAKRLAARGAFDALIALGCVIRGATPHFDYIAGVCAQGLSRVALDYDLPVIFGVLTTETIEQALERAGTKAGNKGTDAAIAALEMVSLLRKLSD